MKSFGIISILLTFLLVSSIPCGPGILVAEAFEAMGDSDINDLMDNCQSGNTDGIQQKMRKFGASQVANQKMGSRQATCLHAAAFFWTSRHIDSTHRKWR